MLDTSNSMDYVQIYIYPRKDVSMDLIRRHRSILLPLLLAAVFCAPLGNAWATEAKIGVVNLKEVYTKSASIQGLKEDIEKFKANAKNAINKLQMDLQSLLQKLNSGKVQGDEKTKLENEIKAKKQELVNEQDSTKIKLSFKNKSLLNSARIQVQQATKLVAEKRSLEGVIAEAAVVYHGSLPDITMDVIKELDGATAEKPEQEVKENKEIETKEESKK